MGSTGFTGPTGITGWQPLGPTGMTGINGLSVNIFQVTGQTPTVSATSGTLSTLYSYDTGVSSANVITLNEFTGTVTVGGNNACRFVSQYFTVSPSNTWIYNFQFVPLQQNATNVQFDAPPKFNVYN
jgi:hypothetical protein